MKPLTTEGRSALARRIMELVVGEFGFSRDELIGPDRPAPLAWARQVGMALTYDLAHLNMGEIGKIWGRNGSTVGKSVKAVRDRIDTEQYFARRVLIIREKAQAFAENL